jgi:thiamine biosynthesis lipoprotein
MGSEMRLRIGEPLEPHLPGPEEAAARVTEYIQEFDARLSRFRAESELCALNDDERVEAPASDLLRSAVSAGLWAAEHSGGLVDPALLGALEAAGYRESRKGVAPVALAAALASAPPRRAASANPHSRWREVLVDDERGLIRRPAGLRFDTGGSGKGLCADNVAEMLRGYSRFVIDCGGDMRVGGPAADAAPYEIEIEHPVSGECAARLPLGRGAIATSGMNTRVWRRDDGTFAHHLIDPSTGEPAWTGLVSATAIAPTTLQAETLAKTAFLLGPRGARRTLRARGGAIVHEDGRVELVGRLKLEPLLRLRISAPHGVAA